MQGHDQAPSTTVTFYVSHVQVTIACDVPEVVAGLSAVWRSAARPMVPTTRWERFTALRVAQGFSILHGARQINACEPASDVLPLVESALYAELRSWHEGHALLHAACVVGPMGPLLLLGDSGAGKSTLARAAVARGYRYASDELTVCKDATVWGVPRAIQFDVVRVGDEHPAYLDGADLDSYRMRQVARARCLCSPSVRLRCCLGRPCSRTLGCASSNAARVLTFTSCQRSRSSPRCIAPRCELRTHASIRSCSCRLYV
jgi:hypothetical protein